MSELFVSHFGTVTWRRRLHGELYTALHGQAATLEMGVGQLVSGVIAAAVEALDPEKKREKPATAHLYTLERVKKPEHHYAKQVRIRISEGSHKKLLAVAVAELAREGAEQPQNYAEIMALPTEERRRAPGFAACRNYSAKLTERQKQIETALLVAYCVEKGLLH